MLRIVVSDDDREGLELDLDAICRDGARKMLRTALRAEVAQYIESARGEVDEAMPWWFATAAPSRGR